MFDINIQEQEPKREITIEWSKDKIYDFLDAFIGKQNILVRVIEEDEGAVILKRKDGQHKIIRFYKVDENDNEVITKRYDKSSNDIRYAKINHDQNVSFDSFDECLTFLRKVRFDHAVSYDHRNLVKPLIKEIYKNADIEISDILSK